MTASLPDALVAIDINIWKYVHGLWRNDFLDAVIPFFRNQWTWAPLYLFLLVFMLMNFKWKGFYWCLFFLLTFAIADQLSAAWLKDVFQRHRPCNDVSLSKWLHIIVPCGSGKSFPSAHATNHFALGIFAAITLRQYVKHIWWFALAWAAIVSYAQVYVGVHFPLDVVCGGILGALVGMLTGFFFHNIISLTPKKKKMRLSEGTGHK